MAEVIRPAGKIKIVDERGYAYIPKEIREEVNVQGKGEISYFKNANTILLVRRGASRKDILKSIDVLKEDIELRWKEVEEMDGAERKGKER